MEFIFEEDIFEVGAEIDAYCSRCKIDTPHTVLTKYEEEIRSVLCTTCNTTHAYRPPRGESEEEAPEPVAVRRRQSSHKLSWADATKHVDATSLRFYSPKESYSAGETVDHPTFGLGYISDVLNDMKLEAVFKDGPRILVHNRKDLPDHLWKKRRSAPAIEKVKDNSKQKKVPAATKASLKKKAPKKQQQDESSSKEVQKKDTPLKKETPKKKTQTKKPPAPPSRPAQKKSPDPAPEKAQKKAAPRVAPGRKQPSQKATPTANPKPAPKKNTPATKKSATRQVPKKNTIPAKKEPPKKKEPSKKNATPRKKAHGTISGGSRSKTKPSKQSPSRKR
jgi:hypothetical protein